MSLNIKKQPYGTDISQLTKLRRCPETTVIKYNGYSVTKGYCHIVRYNSVTSPRLLIISAFDVCYIPQSPDDIN